MPRKSIQEIIADVTRQLETETPEERAARRLAELPGDLVFEWLIQKEDEHKARAAGVPIPMLTLHAFTTQLYQRYGQDIAHQVVDLILLDIQMNGFRDLESEI